jgi:glycosyltransferase involved in cell wall biosynthesis
LRDVPNYDVVRWRGRTASACVLIPVINKGGRIGRLLSGMHMLNIAGIADIIAVDGGSKDGSLATERLDEASDSIDQRIIEIAYSNLSILTINLCNLKLKYGNTFLADKTLKHL